MTRIRDQLALVTGASAGIGAACAAKLAEDGADLILWARRLDRLDELAGEIETHSGVAVETRAVDVRDREAVSAAAADLIARGKVPDILLNNAGLAAGLAKIQEGDLEDWDRMIDTNVKGLLFVTRALLPAMIERDSGHVVNLGSIAGYQVYEKGSVYNASKFAVRALTEGTNLDLLGTNLRASSVDPGLVETDFSLVRFDGDRERAEAVYQGYTPLAREDIAEAVSFIVNAPPHMNVTSMKILATAQRSAHSLHKEPV